jgi:hypothetical protein
MGEATNGQRERAPAWVNIDAVLAPELRARIAAAANQLEAEATRLEELFRQSAAIIAELNRDLPELGDDSYVQLEKWVTEYRRFRNAGWRLVNGACLAMGEPVYHSGSETWPAFYVREEAS